MQPIKDLKIEHDAVQVTLRILDKICQRIEMPGNELDIRHMDQLLDFIKDSQGYLNCVVFDF